MLEQAALSSQPGAPGCSHPWAAALRTLRLLSYLSGLDVGFSSNRGYLWNGHRHLEAEARPRCESSEWTGCCSRLPWCSRGMCIRGMWGSMGSLCGGRGWRSCWFMLSHCIGSKWLSLPWEGLLCPLSAPCWAVQWPPVHLPILLPSCTLRALVIEPQVSD